MALTQANEARLQNALNKQFRFETGIETLQFHLDNHAIKFDQKTVKKYEYNRIKFNRMDQRQQDVYNRQLEEIKEEYRAHYSDGTFSVIPKMVYDFYNN